MRVVGTAGRALRHTKLLMLYEPNNLRSVSIDRIDNSKGYIRGNIQLVCRFINFAKNNLPGRTSPSIVPRVLRIMEGGRGRFASSALCLRTHDLDHGWRDLVAGQRAWSHCNWLLPVDFGFTLYPK